jgi:hypothetical protein
LVGEAILEKVAFVLRGQGPRSNVARGLRNPVRPTSGLQLGRTRVDSGRHPVALMAAPLPDNAVGSIRNVRAEDVGGQIVAPRARKGELGCQSSDLVGRLGRLPVSADRNADPPVLCGNWIRCRRLLRRLTVVVMEQAAQ